MGRSNYTYIDPAGRLQVDGEKLFKDKKVIRDIEELRRIFLTAGQNRVFIKTNRVPIKGK